ncbi:hypothetical protein ACKC5O_17465 [Aeromonas schubertii]|uniref:hypothetical protein n=1 Tax=Aeromonas schubertii TaxID=652 RepID=UPI0038B46A27
MTLSWDALAQHTDRIGSTQGARRQAGGRITGARAWGWMKMLHILMFFVIQATSGKKQRKMCQSFFPWFSLMLHLVRSAVMSLWVLSFGRFFNRLVAVT